MREVAAKKLGVLLSAPPDAPNFDRGLKLAQTALDLGITVYLYCIDEAVAGIDDPRVQRLKESGLNLFACAYAAQRRHITIAEQATFAGLSIVHDLIANTDRFVSFN